MIRQNGVSLGNFNSGRYDGRRVKSTMLADIEANPTYKPAARNGFRGDIPLANLVLYLPFYLFSSSVLPTIDFYGHTCTVVGATPVAQGKNFDGVNDIATVPDTSVLQNIFTGGGTLFFTIKPTNGGEGNVGQSLNKDGGGTGWSLRFANDNGSASTLDLHYSFSGNDLIRRTTNRDIVYGAWHTVMMTYDNGLTTNSPVFYINGSSVAVTSQAAPTGTADTDAGSDFIIGNNAATSATVNGIIGEVLAFDIILPASAATHMHNSLIWRYG